MSAVKQSLYWSVGVKTEPDLKEKLSIYRLLQEDIKSKNQDKHHEKYQVKCKNMSAALRRPKSPCEGRDMLGAPHTR